MGSHVKEANSSLQEEIISAVKICLKEKFNDDVEKFAKSIDVDSLIVREWLSGKRSIFSDDINRILNVIGGRIVLINQDYDKYNNIIIEEKWKSLNDSNDHLIELNNDLSDKIIRLQEENEKLKSGIKVRRVFKGDNNEDLKEKVKNLEKELYYLRGNQSKIDLMKLNIESLKQNLQEVTAQKISLERALQDKEGQKRGSNIKDLKDKIVKLTEENRRLAKENSSKKTSFNEITILKETVDKIAEDREKLANKLIYTEETLSKVLNENVRMKEEFVNFEDFQASSIGVNQQFYNLYEENIVLRNKLSVSKNENIEISKKINDLNKENKKLQENKNIENDKNNKINKLEAEKYELTSKLEELHSQNEKLMEFKHKYIENTNKFEEDYRILSSRESELNKKIDGLNAKNDLLKNFVNNYLNREKEVLQLKRENNDLQMREKVRTLESISNKISNLSSNRTKNTVSRSVTSDVNAETYRIIGDLISNEKMEEISKLITIDIDEYYNLKYNNNSLNAEVICLRKLLHYLITNDIDYTGINKQRDILQYESTSVIKEKISNNSLDYSTATATLFETVNRLEIALFMTYQKWCELNKKYELALKESRLLVVAGKIFKNMAEILRKENVELLKINGLVTDEVLQESQ